MQAKLRRSLSRSYAVSPARSANMRAVGSAKNRSTEVRFRLRLVRNRIVGWIVRPKGIPGNPDFYFPDLRIALFLDGCFWHSCPKCGHLPKTNKAFWKTKFQLNRARDRQVEHELRNRKISVIRIWEHELNDSHETRVLVIMDWLKKHPVGNRASPGPNLRH